jgi:Ca2+-binding EF-hand superfamily protein
MKTNSFFATTALVLGTSMLALSAPQSGGKGKPQGPPPLPPEVLAKYDTNHDGKLSDAEKAAMKADLEAKRKELIAKYDTNGDGVLDEKERAAMKADLDALRLAEQTAKFLSLDTDGVTGLSLAEFTAGAPKDATPERIKAAFDHLDANKDGSISLTEFTAKPKPPAPPTGKK